MSARTLSETAIRYFLQVVNSGSISEAASRLHVVPSAVSRQISRLENELGSPLLERQSRGVALSPAGELLAAYARRTLLDAEQVSQEIAALRDQSEALISIACTEGFASHCLPRAIAGFRQRGANSCFRIDVATAAEVTRRVREGEVDIGFSFSLGAAKGISVAYSQPAPVLALVAPQHELAGQGSLALHEVVRHPLALPGPHTTIRQLLDLYSSREGINYRSILDTDHLESLLNFCMAGHAITFCGELFARERLQTGQLIALEVPELRGSERSIEIQTLARRPLSGPLQSFIDYIQGVLPGDT
ncbi:LysR family transcriptional regulator [Pseudomonas sp. DTU_2021_1001937_2_SI_NGA_ILE_001]|uniref:LysR family transcriptional regulator n=1 Tax=Pseudomonas sp. DTU_2021_1001937_2_SI_NGA_ILE_001 TaxID=3077589 RepID=UPI0025D5791B|nr:LysR family transcriptional regulator [Pseudomonas sp. DTU_2021_1001937_2_SI_NGA_ILE_001]WNW10979.1 LysR family transcriptional regulator [Pseudomonas sp. DTU_2021_1001937_2_SI_NGA_ILE_001]